MMDGVVIKDAERLTDLARAIFVAAGAPQDNGARDEYYRIADETLARMKAVPPAPGFAEVLIPGEPEARSRQQRLRDGIPLDTTTWQALVATAEELGVGTSAE
jgi:LDH2 family malate/lactate/ureidoglycolate dehydrogenase